MAKGIPQDVLDLLAAADKRKGFPAGTMLSVLQQETGGQVDRFLADPTTYHYAADAQGRRIAPHTGKVSTAFGPFGILESTAADPGYGVAPLKDKSLPEQIRFASDYAAARGLANYGEGKKYEAQVVARRDGARQGVPAVPSISEQAAAWEPPVQQEAPVVAAAPVQPAPAAPSSVAAGPDAWQEFLARSAAQPEVRPQDLAAYGQPAAPGVQMPVFNTAPIAAQRPDFRSFLAMKRWVA